MSLRDIPGTISDNTEYQVVKDTPDELVITFTMDSRSVRLMQCRDLDVTDEKSYNQSAKSRHSQERVNAQLEEPPMDQEVTQYMMARLWNNCIKTGEFTDLECLESWKSTSDGSSNGFTKDKEVFYKLRLAAQEEFWLHMSTEQREAARRECISLSNDDSVHPSGLLESQLDKVKKNWQNSWNSQRRHPDFFRAYLRDERAAENVWEHIKEDVLVVVDENREVIFANIENLAQLLFGEHLTEVLERYLDMWSFFTPLPFPESSRHVVDSYIRKLHPELDLSRATVDTLPKAKMCVAHYRCWATQGDPHGRYIYRTRDCHFARGDPCPDLLFSDFCRAALAKSAAMIRFLVKTLDPKYYNDCVDILANIDERVKLPTKDPEDFISLFAFGVNVYTQRHRDRNDVAGGLAGLCTFGRYTGGNLCVPQLNLKVSYQPGACALIRGTGLDHMVQDYSGPRFFLIGTNHESVKRHAWRKLGRLPALAPKRKRDRSSSAESDDSEENVMETTCINLGDDLDDSIQYTNRELHGAGALNDSSSESERA